jgi:uncharacterized protein
MIAPFAMPAHEFKIPVGDLDAAGKAYVFPIRAAWMRGALEDDGTSAAVPQRGPHQAKVSPAGTDGELDIRASKSGTDVIIHGILKAELEAPCARCLEPVRFRVDHPVSVLMVHTAPARGRDDDAQERELSSEEADTFPYDGETVVLDDFVRDELLLETPMIPLCSEDCPGMRPPPAQRETEPREQDIDPRLMPLLRFQSKAKKE